MLETPTRLHGGRDHFHGTVADAHGPAADPVMTSAGAVESSADGADAVETSADPVESSVEEYSEDQYSSEEHLSEGQDDSVEEDDLEPPRGSQPVKQDDSAAEEDGGVHLDARVEARVSSADGADAVETSADPVELSVEQDSEDSVVEEQDGGGGGEAREEARLNHLPPRGSQPVLQLDDVMNGETGEEALPAPESCRVEAVTAAADPVMSSAGAVESSADGADAVETFADPVESSVEEYSEDSCAEEQDAAVDEAYSIQINSNEPGVEAKVELSVEQDSEDSVVEEQDEARVPGVQRSRRTQPSLQVRFRAKREQLKKTTHGQGSRLPSKEGTT